METYLAWLKEITGQAGPDIDSIHVEERGVTILVSINSERCRAIAREFANAGHMVWLINGDTGIDFNA